MQKYFKRSIFQRIMFFLLPSSKARLRYLKKHNVFAELGNNCFYQCRKIPVEPRLVKIHNNVVIAADVQIIPHDIIHLMVNNISDVKYPIHLGCVEIMDNCFIGSESVILNEDFSIIFSNCVGGVVSHELGLRFNSPTVNLFFTPGDYLKFITNLKRYCEIELVEKKDCPKTYPVGQLGDITVFFMHYTSFEEAKA